MLNMCQTLDFIIANHIQLIISINFRYICQNTHIYLHIHKYIYGGLFILLLILKRHREVKLLAQGHPAGEMQSWL